MKYALDRFEPTPFEQLSAALARRVIGSDVRSFGPGRDQGRDFTFTGVINFQEEIELGRFETWNGYTVFQVKCKNGLAAKPEDNAKWVLTTAKAEIDEWEKGTRNPLPKYLVLVTNVPLTPAKNGGLREVEKGIDAYLTRTDGDGRTHAKIPGLAGVRLWDGNQVESLLDTYPDVARKFVGLTSPNEAFDLLRQFTDSLPDDHVEPALHALSRRLLIENRFARFDEAGASDEQRTSLHDVFFDLPIVERDADHLVAKAVQFVLAHGEQVLRNSIFGSDRPKHLLMTGSPGNGKSTITQFLERVYHCAFLGEEELVNLHAAVRDGVVDAVRRNGLRAPQNRRWAFRVDLAEYVARHDALGDSTMLRWISDKASALIDEGRLTPAALASWRRQWPWLLLLDGLDEVTDASTRRRLVEEIESLVAEADAQDADLLVVVTTRPTGYADELESTYFRRIDLAPLSPDDARSYSRLVADHRFNGEADRRESVLRDLDAALASTETANLMRTPLQVLIMLIILESSGKLPNDRYRLFWGYYKTVFARESKKPTALAPILRDHEPHIEMIHIKAAVRLHIESQARPNSAASISPQEFRALVQDVLRHEGYPDTDELVERISAAATERLVLLVPRLEGGIGFEVRSIQEVLTARAIASGPDDEIIDRLRQTAHNPHWRNVLIFAVGKVFSENAEHLRQRIVEMVRGIDSDQTWRLGAVCRIGPALALDLFDDGLAAQRPNADKALLEIGLGFLGEPAPSNELPFAAILLSASRRSLLLHRVVANALRDALSGGPIERETAFSFQSGLSYAADPTQAEAAASLEAVRSHPGVSMPTENTDAYAEFDWSRLADDAAALVEGNQPRSALREFVGSLSRLGHEEDDALSQLQGVLADEDSAAALELILSENRTALSHEISTMRDLMFPPILRAAITASDLKL